MKTEIVIEAMNEYPGCLVGDAIEILFLKYGKSTDEVFVNVLRIVGFQPCYGFMSYLCCFLSFLCVQWFPAQHDNMGNF